MLVGLPPLRLGFSCHQVGEPLDRGQIHAAVFECAARELSCFRMTQPGKVRQRGKNRRDHRATAVHVQFGDVFAGGAVRSGEP